MNILLLNCKYHIMEKIVNRSSIQNTFRSVPNTILKDGDSSDVYNMKLNDPDIKSALIVIWFNKKTMNMSIILRISKLLISGKGRDILLAIDTTDFTYTELSKLDDIVPDLCDSINTVIADSSDELINKIVSYISTPIID